MESCVMGIYEDGWVKNALDDLSLGKPGAEREVLEAFAFEICSGGTIGPGLQQLVNAILVKSLHLEKLPTKASGRPSADVERTLPPVLQYWNLRDNGVPYNEAIEAVSNQFHISDRHVARLIQKHKRDVGETADLREWSRDVGRRLKCSPSAQALLNQLKEVGIDHRPESEIQGEIESRIRAALDAANND